MSAPLRVVAVVGTTRSVSAGKPVLLAATGGSDRHAMVIDQALCPLFGFFQAWTAPMGVYLTGRHSPACFSASSKLFLRPSRT